MTKVLNVLDADGPLAKMVGASLIILSVAFSFFLIFHARPDKLQVCIDAGGSYAYKHDSRNTDSDKGDTYTETCTKK